MNTSSLGVDIGNVIINNRLQDPEVTDVNEAIYASFPPCDDVFSSLKILNTRFGGNIFLISKCTEWAQVQILLWLKSHDFYARTGIQEANVYFVRKRNEKDGVCQKLGITHFIDDRLEVLSYMVDSTPHLYLYQPDPEEVEQFKDYLPKVTVLADWKDVVEKCV